MASAALHQSISWAGLDLAGEDYSKVVEVYEKISGVSVNKSSKANGYVKEGNKEGDFGLLLHGKKERTLEVRDKQ